MCSSNNILTLFRLLPGHWLSSSLNRVNKQKGVKGYVHSRKDKLTTLYLKCLCEILLKNSLPGETIMAPAMTDRVKILNKQKTNLEIVQMNYSILLNDKTHQDL